MDHKEDIYCSFLLRIWVEPEDDGAWRFSLEDTQTGTRMGFSSLKNVCEYLEGLQEIECRNERES